MRKKSTEKLFLAGDGHKKSSISKQKKYIFSASKYGMHFNDFKKCSFSLD